MQTTDPVASRAGGAIPESLKQMQIWVIWDLREKVPLSPWETGDMYRAGWGDGVVDDPDSRMQARPETTYSEAQMFADIPPRELHESHAFPRGDDGTPDLPESLEPTVLLPHDPPNPPLMQVDFDDVRDPETGEISEEVAKLVDRLDAFTEISVSGEGLHCYVRAELPGALGKFIADLETAGAIELYDHGRFTACTWDHMDGTPVKVPERQDVIDDIVLEYETDTLRQRRTRDREREERDIDEVLASMRSDQDGRGNAYIDTIRVEDVAREGRYGTDYLQYNNRHRDWHNGPHPGHGPVHSDLEDCTNFGINGDQWNCFAHEGGRGGPLNLLAVVKGVLSCDRAVRLYDRPKAMAKTCLYARDMVEDLEDEDPPYTALVGVAESEALIMADEDEGILGGDCWKIARVIYDEMEPADVKV